ncbi:MAG: prepilin-type N-terminal cleavage/methylation domain-containing protein, partial [Armatimonadetes bacterium]|nr:prepilin-type N-terminal cleavage/methylation domain-containing protein [Armatimonadota bacterium]
MMRHTLPTIKLTRRGLTLIELLIAMVVLLVGIYTVAAGFPRMLNAIRGEGDRTGMTRLAEQTMTRAADNQYGLPDAITGGGSVDPETYPDDLTAPHEAINAMEDIGEVRGEAFRVPAPYNVPGVTTGVGYSYYVLGQGPADCTDWATGYPNVYMLVPLTEWDEDPRASGAIPLEANWFYVDRDTGEIIVPAVVTTTDGTQARRWGTSGLPGVSNVAVDYAWTYPPNGDDEPVVRHVQGELPSDVDAATYSGLVVATVHPANLGSGIRLLPGQTRAWARVDFVREEFGDALPDGAGRYVLDNRYGLTLGFHPADVGLTLKVDYQLRTYMTTEDLDAQTAGETVYPRRLPLMIEDQVIQRQVDRTDASAVDYSLIRLAVKGIDDEPLFSQDLSGAPIPNVHVLAVDLQTGEMHVDGAGADPVTVDAADQFDPSFNGFADGLVAVPISDSGGSKSYVGHTWRFIYRTLNRNTVQMQKAPRYYVDSETARAYLAAYLPSGQDEVVSLADVDYRTYRLDHVAPPNDTTRRLGVIEFGQWLTAIPPAGDDWATAESSSGETVAVSYAYVPVPHMRKQVWGELHTVPV